MSLTVYNRIQNKLFNFDRFKFGLKIVKCQYTWVYIDTQNAIVNVVSGPYKNVFYA